MRPVLPGDVAAAGCALLHAKTAARAGLMRRMLAEAEAADSYRRKTGCAHPVWGNGSLMAVAMARPRAREPFLDDPEYCACMALVFDALLARSNTAARRIF
ncbi:hypothetical protein [Aliiroseovarius subalbicans]|uniref:DUF7742 family protein n=1 Tax=Aliiroseovarius subalbicans TaxID=2925840 RepID=UPI001F55AC31|nr:hypothetical protein [Aliiroseovarius subalbicans]MCI2398641.1 hypothetical protein [Aliiroseovarius subalbicans]